MTDSAFVFVNKHKYVERMSHVHLGNFLQAVLGVEPSHRRRSSLNEFKLFAINK